VLACDALHTATANGGGWFTFGDLLHACVKLAEVRHGQGEKKRGEYMHVVA